MVFPEPVIGAMEPQRVKPRVAEQHFQIRARGRVAVEDRRDIFAHRLSQTNHRQLVWLRRSSAVSSTPVSATWTGATRLETNVYTATAVISMASFRRWSNRILLRYLSPKLGNTTTINFPAFSGRLPTSTAATVAAPDEIPINNPSSSAKRRAILIASSLETWITSEM